MTACSSDSDPLWITEIEVGGGVLGLTLCPGKKGASQQGFRWERDLAADVAAIATWGATAVVTLIEPREFGALAVESLPETVAAVGMEWHHLPITDVSVPDCRFELRWAYAWRRLRARLAAGERILLHCNGGLGRAGTVAAAVLVGCGESPASAIDRVRAVRPGAIETDAQEAWVLQLSSRGQSISDTGSRPLACLVGGAIGDALGYRVEFERWPEISRKYGPAGISLATATGPLIVSDDTQMTLFTLEGMARAAGREGIVREVRGAYLDWLGTQRNGAAAREPIGKLAAWEAMRHARAPGKTCLSALERGAEGTAQSPINESKGCGGVMRTAPLAFLAEAVNDEQVFELGAAAAALTHGHPDGYLPAGAMAVLTRCALRGEPWTSAVSRVLDLLSVWPESRGTVAAVEAAAKAAAAGPPSRDRVRELGEGWVGEEALAVGLYAAMTTGTFAECIGLAANHDGDSDSTASIAGQLHGARHGLEALPSEAVYRLDVIEPLLAVFQQWEESPGHRSRRSCGTAGSVQPGTPVPR